MDAEVGSVLVLNYPTMLLYMQDDVYCAVPHQYCTHAKYGLPEIQNSTS